MPFSIQSVNFTKLKFVVFVHHNIFCLFICILFCFVTNLLTTPKGMRRFLSYLHHYYFIINSLTALKKANPLASLNSIILLICNTIVFVSNPLTTLKKFTNPLTSLNCSLPFVCITNSYDVNLLTSLKNNC